MRGLQGIAPPAHHRQQPRLGFRRRRVAQQTVQRRPQRVQVAPRVRARAFHLLRRRKAPRERGHAACQRRRLHVPGLPLGQAKVEQDQAAIRTQLEVLGLEVAVDDRRLAAVQIVQHVEQLVAPAQHLVEGKGGVAVIQQSGEVIAGDVVHDQTGPGGVGEVVGDAGQGGMVEVGQELGLVGELAADAVADAHEQLEGDTAVEALVERLVDGAKAALPHQPHNAVAVMNERIWFQHGFTIACWLVLNAELELTHARFRQRCCFWLVARPLFWTSPRGAKREAQITGSENNRLSVRNGSRAVVLL